MPSCSETLSAPSDLTWKQCADFAQFTADDLRSGEFSTRYTAMKAGDFLDRMVCCSPSDSWDEHMNCCRKPSSSEPCPTHMTTKSNVASVCHLTSVGNALLVPRKPADPNFGAGAAPVQGEDGFGVSVVRIVALAVAVAVIGAGFIISQAARRRHAASIYRTMKTLKDAEVVNPK